MGGVDPPGAAQRRYAGADHGRCPMTCRERDVHFMNRRAFLKSVTGAGVLAAAGGLATPAISQRAAARVLRFVPQAGLANFDPILNTPYLLRNRAPLRS